MRDPVRPRGTVPEGTGLVHLDTCGSTNAEAMRLALASIGERGEPLPFWVAADRQTAGKGRSGRAWASADAGNLYASLAISPGCPVVRASELSLVAGVAAIDALRRAAPQVPVRLKWPNDILAGGAKLGGILVESTSIRGDLVAIVGVGLNLVASPDIQGRPTTALAAHISGNHNLPSALEMLAFLAEAMHDWLAKWELGFGPIRAAWLDRAGATGERLAVNTGNGLVEGAFAGLDEGGALLLDLGSSGLRRFTFGDVTLVDTQVDRK